MKSLTYSELANTLNRAQSARIASFTYAAKGTGEVARHTLLLGCNVARAYRRDVALLRAKGRTMAGKATPQRQACAELIKSLRESLRVGIGHNSRYTQAGLWEGTGARGVRVRVDGESGLQVTGFSLGKVVIVPGVHKSVKSSEKTLAKNKLRAGMKSARFRAFSFENIIRIAANGKVLEIETPIA